MRATTTKRQGGGDARRDMEKQARRERLAFRAIERRVRWERKRALLDAKLGGV